MKNVILFSLLILGASASSQEFKPLPENKKPKSVDTIDHENEYPELNAGTRFEVGSYDPATKTYKLVSRADRTAGPYITTPENLAKAVDNINLDKITEAPYSIVRFDYKVADGKELLLLYPEQVQARAAKKSKK